MPEARDTLPPAMVHLTRRVTFNAAHKLYNDAWSPERNAATFGKCANANWHGHNYQLFVTVTGEPHPDTGFVMDAKRLADLIKEHVTEHLDHRNLNLDVPWLRGKMVTSENVAVGIWGQLSPKLTAHAAEHNPTLRLHSVRLTETENIFVEYFGPDQ